MPQPSKASQIAPNDRQTPILSSMNLVVANPRARCERKGSPGGPEQSSGLGSLACARFRLGSPRFHEPEDHADVADSLVGHRRR